VVGGLSNGATGNYDAIVGGQGNSISGTNNGSHRFIGGGQSNTMGEQGLYSIIVGGETNSLFGRNNFIGGGATNVITSAVYSFIGGGSNHSMTGGNNRMTIGGGQSNTTSATHATVCGGQSNTASGTFSAVVGGSGNTASGSSCSFIGGGLNNSVAGQQSSVCGGRENSIGGGGDKFAFIGGGYLNSTPSGDKTFIGGGQQNQATATYGAILGGLLNLASGGISSVLGGERNTASGTYSSTIGGFYSVSNLYGQTSHASGAFSAAGDAQAHELIWRRAITGTATTELFLDGASVAAILPSTNSVWHGIIDISSICTAQGDGTTVTGDVAATSYKVTIKRIGTTTSLVGTVQEIGSLNADVSMAAVAFIITNNDTNESLQIAFTPPPTAGSTTTIRVIATFRGTQIKY
jgi:hypothetical protein